ncbi:MAG: hypothetical protein HZC42_14345 [Candidatus Eisenbacteria bacterium]|nr:hypothetical protein [Candidatus Eisenbacteria bacterium]
MTRATRGQVLLLTARPAAHGKLVRALRGLGARVSVPHAAPQTLRLIARRPTLVLVDLANGAGLTPEIVDLLNRRRDPILVLALHDGSFGLRERAVAGLSVAGFCPAHDSQPIVNVVAGLRAGGAVAVH